MSCGHGRVECSSCGTVILTCRCMEASKNVTYQVCDECSTKNICSDYYHKMYAREWKNGDTSYIKEACPTCHQRGFGNNDPNILAAQAVRA